MKIKSYICDVNTVFMPTNTIFPSFSTLMVVPCYNEAMRMQTELFLDFVQNHSSISFLFVNDGSTDATAQMLEDFSRKYSQVYFLDLAQNGGKAEAVRQGMLYAAENISCDAIGFWDADLATPLNEIPFFVQCLETGGYDMVTGLRLMRLGARVYRKKKRHYLGRIFATVASEMLRLPVYDTQCGAKLFRSTVVPMLFKDTFSTRWLFDVEILARYIREYGREKALQKIYEYPVFQWEDITGSRLKMKDFLFAPVELWKIKERYF